jgi:hypothetical protein
LIISYDNELELPGAATIPVRTVIPRILSNRNQIILSSDNFPKLDQTT